MRTAIFVGLVYVGDAIGTPHYNANAIAWLAMAFALFFIADVVDFFRNRN